MQMSLEDGRKTQDFIFGGREFQKDASENDRLLLNKSVPGLGKYSVVGLGKMKEFCKGGLIMF